MLRGAGRYSNPLGLFTVLQQLLGLQWLEWKSTIFSFPLDWGGPEVAVASTVCPEFWGGINFPIVLGLQQLPSHQEEDLLFKRLISSPFSLTVCEGSETFPLSLNHQLKSFWVEFLWCNNMKACTNQSAKMLHNEFSDGTETKLPILTQK